MRGWLLSAFAWLMVGCAASAQVRPAAQPTDPKLEAEDTADCLITWEAPASLAASLRFLQLSAAARGSLVAAVVAGSDGQQHVAVIELSSCTLLYELGWTSHVQALRWEGSSLVFFHGLDAQSGQAVEVRARFSEPPEGVAAAEKHQLVATPEGAVQVVHTGDGAVVLDISRSLDAKLAGDGEYLVRANDESYFDEGQGARVRAYFLYSTELESRSESELARSSWLRFEGFATSPRQPLVVYADEPGLVLRDLRQPSASPVVLQPESGEPRTAWTAAWTLDDHLALPQRLPDGTLALKSRPYASWREPGAGHAKTRSVSVKLPYFE